MRFADVAIRADGSAWAVGAGLDNEAWVGRFTLRGWKRVPLAGVEGPAHAVVVDQEDHLWVFTGAPDYAPDMFRSSAARWDGRSWRITDLGGGIGITKARAIGLEVWFLRNGRITLRQRLEDGKCQGGDVTALASRPGTPGLWAVGTRSSCTAGGVLRPTVYRAP
ncbi:hypothetical protein ACQP2K_31615 [Microbispora siamensis]